MTDPPIQRTRATDPPRAGTAADRKHTLQDWRTWALGILFICLALAGVASCRATQAADDARDAAEKVADVERQDRISNRATAFRLCSRNSVDRAFAHSRIRLSQGPAAMAKLQHYKALAILDCRPNLRGKGAAPYSRQQQTDFVDRWERGELTNVELGICPRSAVGSVGDKDC